MIGDTMKGMAQKGNKSKTIYSRDGLSVYGYIRQNFDQKCHIQEIIATIIQFYMKKGGFLFVCGWGGDGRLGIKEFYYNYCMEPTRVQSVKEIIDIAACDNHTMMVDYEGSLWACGSGADGKLGRGNTRRVKVPKQVQLNSRAIAVSVGEKHSLILIENGSVLSCGKNSSGQLGHGDTENQSIPKIIEALKEHKITQISSGFYHNGALSENGNLFMWGNNDDGPCGVGQDKGDKIKTPTVVKLKEKVSMIECGDYHSLLITMNSSLYSFGYGTFGRLGHGTYEDKYIPTLTESLKDVKFMNVAGGHNHTLCVDEEFNVWAFGANHSGECGHSQGIKAQTTPKKIEYFTVNRIKVKDVEAGGELSCVITHNNECFVFGKNTRNQLGLKEKKDYFTPTKLPLSVQKASMGLDHSAFISD